MAKKQKHVTPPMVVRYCYLTVPTTTYKADGQYTVKVAIEDGTPEAEELKALLKERYDAASPATLAQLNPAQKKKLIVVQPYEIEENKETGEETGFITFSFSMAAKVTRKSDSKVFAFTPDIFDAGNQLITGSALKALKIGAGTIMRVSFSAERSYTMEATGADNKKFTKSGLSVDLEAVKILELVEYGASAGNYGFGDDDGGSYSAPKDGGDFADTNDDDMEGSNAVPNDEDGDF